MTERWLVFDTETSDLIKNSVINDDYQPRIIEFYGAVIDPESGERLDELEFLANPGFTISDEIQRITHITPDMLKDQPPFKHYEGQLRSIINGSTAVLAHNLSFDHSVVETEIRRCGTLDQLKWPLKRICTVEQTEWIKGYRLSLTALHEELFGEKFVDAHRARHDVEALIRCVVELYKRGDL